MYGNTRHGGDDDDNGDMLIKIAYITVTAKVMVQGYGSRLGLGLYGFG